MEKIIELLREKNQCLEKFYFLNEAELVNFGGGRFDMVESFYHARDRILDLIACLDTVIEEESVKEGVVPTDAGRAEVEGLLRTKDEIVKSILAQDLQILAYIEKEKSNIIKELSTTSKARKAVGAYANTERLAQLDEK